MPFYKNPVLKGFYFPIIRFRIHVSQRVIHRKKAGLTGQGGKKVQVRQKQEVKRRENRIYERGTGKSGITYI